MTILCIESSTLNCSVAALHQDEVVVHLEERAERYVHAERLHVLIDQVISAIDQPIDAIAVGKGPGSYTGLRIGVSAAKGLAEGFGVPLIAVPTLDHFGNQVRHDHPGYDFYVALLDARRMEVYTKSFDASGNALDDTHALIIDGDSFTALLDQGKVLFFGDATEKTRGSIDHVNAYFLDGALPNAVGVARLAVHLAERQVYADVIELEPFYLKEFIAGTPKKQL